MSSNTSSIEWIINDQIVISFAFVYWKIIIGSFLFIYSISPYLLDSFRYKLPPGPIPLPFIGNFASLADKKQKPWEQLRQLAKKHGPFYTFYFGRYRLIVLHSNEAIRKFLVENANIFSWRQDQLLPGMESLKPGVISASYDTWKTRRRFGLRAMRDFGMGKEIMVQKVQGEVASLIEAFEKVEGQYFNPRHLLTNSISNVICSLIFGKRFAFDDPAFVELTDLIDIIASRSLVSGVIFLIFPFLKYFFDANQAKDFGVMQKKIDRMVDEIIKEHRLDYNSDNIRDFPDLFIKMENEDNDTNMNQTDFSLFLCDMFAAGTETVSTVLHWTLLYLASDREIQKRCHQEIDRHIDANRLPSAADRPNLIYIEALMRETLRHSSIAPSAFLHSNLENGTTMGGYDIPPYTLIMYNLAGLHYDPEYWDSPKEFRPERWISNDGSIMNHPTHFIPFGVGPRLCLGESLAKVEYFIFIVALLQRYEFEIEEKVDINNGEIGIVNAPPRFRVKAIPRL